MYPIQMVSGASKPRREREGSGQRQPQTSQVSPFTATLEKAAQASEPTECYTVTYDRRSRLQTYYYCPSREYTF